VIPITIILSSIISEQKQTNSLERVLIIFDFFLIFITFVLINILIRKEAGESFENERYIKR